MKFLLISSMKDVFLTLPSSVIRQLIQATHDSMNQQKEAGKVSEMYWIPGWNRFMAIYECASAEELWKNINEIPAVTFFNFEVYSLIDYNEAMNVALENMERADRLFPGAVK